MQAGKAVFFPPPEINPPASEKSVVFGAAPAEQEGTCVAHPFGYLFTTTSCYGSIMEGAQTRQGVMTPAALAGKTLAYG